MARHWSQRWAVCTGEGEGFEKLVKGKEKNPLGFYNKMLNLIIVKHLKVVIKLLSK